VTHRAGPPPVSAYTRKLLDEAIEVDRRLVVETGYDLLDIRSEIAAMPSDEVEEVVIDGFRWRYYWRPENVLWRQETEARERARVAIEISHDLAGAMRWSGIGPTHAQLAKLRATPAWVRSCPWAGCRWTATVYDPTVTAVSCPQHRARDVSEMRQAS
jgi:hypothetical protein